MNDVPRNSEETSRLLSNEFDPEPEQFTLYTWNYIPNANCKKRNLRELGGFDSAD